jgi:LysM repeat protein
MKPISFKQAFVVVLGVHVIAACFLFTSAGKVQGAVSPQTKSEDKKFLESSEAKYVGVEESTIDAEAAKKKKVTEILKKIQEVRNEQKETNIVTVQRGDTLTKISKRYNVKVQTIVELNKLKDINKIVEGQKLIIKK